MESKREKLEHEIWRKEKDLKNEKQKNTLLVDCSGLGRILSPI